MTLVMRTVVTVILISFGVAASAFAQTASTIHYVYDELGRLMAVTDPTGDTVTYTYDEVGNLLSIGRYASSQVSIISFSPGGAPVGASITINGTGFSATANQNTVTFNGVAATVSSASLTQLIATVPAGASTGPISVTSPAGTATSTTSFLVTTGGGIPTVTGFSPSIGSPGTSVTVTGTNFQPVAAQNHIKFNITHGVVQSVTGSTQMAGTVPAPATSGPITVVTSLGSGVSATDFFVPPSPYMPPDVAFTARLTPGVTQVVTIGTASKIALLTFAATAGERISVSFGAGPAADVTIRRPDGGILTTSTIGAATFIDAVPITITGTYTLLLDPLGTNVGSTGVTLYEFADVTGPISPGGTSVSVPLGTPGQNGLLTFNGTAGQKVSASIARTSGTFSSCFWHLTMLKPDGSVLGTTYACGGTTLFLDTQTLPVTGIYTLLIDPGDAQTGTVNAALYSVTHATGSITSDGTSVSVPLTTPGQDGLLTFSGTAGQKVSASIARTSGTFSCYWYLTVLKPDGSVLGTTYACGGTTAFLDTQTLPVTGTYTLLIDPRDMQTGTVNAALYSVTHATGPITADGTAVNVPLTTPGQNGLLTFGGTAGQKVSASIARTSGTFGCYWYLTILKPDGSVLGTTFACSGTTLFLDTQTLPVTGTYTLLVDPGDMHTGTVNAALYGVTHTTGPITSDGTAVNVPLTTPGQDGLLTFSGTAGQKVSASIALTSGTFGCYWYLSILKPDGSVLGTTFACGGTTLFLDTQTLPVTGTYTLLVDPRDTHTGTVNAALYGVTHATGPITSDGTAVNVSLTTPGQNGLLTFSGSAGQKVSASIALASGTFGCYWYLSILKPDGSVLGSTFACGGTTLSLGTQTLPVNGTYTFAIDPTGMSTGTVSAALSTVP